MSDNPKRKTGDFQEVGTTGLNVMSGYIQQAYHTDLQYPAVVPIYQKMWRSAPEIAISRQFFATMAGDLRLTCELPEDTSAGEPTDDDKRAVDFANSVLDDIEDGALRWLANCVTRVPFFGWGWWEAPLGVRNPEWKGGGDDPWRSKYSDNLIGVRRLAWRDYSSFSRWDIDDATGRLRGFIQQDYPNPEVTIPLERSLHITFGDDDNPEGLATLEAAWRLERIRYALEVIQGIGYEHSAGHVKFTVYEELDAGAKAEIQRAARAILSAQEGNYITEINDKFLANILDVNFAAAPNILEAIKYYSITMLSLLGMQWVAFSTLSGVGSLASMDKASSIAFGMFNSMTDGFVQQADKQLMARLFNHPINKAAFPNMTRRPRLTVSKAQRDIDLTELGQFVSAFGALFDMSAEDILTIRRKSGFMPEVSPDPGEVVRPAPSGSQVPNEPEPLPADETPATPEDAEREAADADMAELAVRPLKVTDAEQPVDISDEAVIEEDDINAARRSFRKFAEDEAPNFANLLDADVDYGE